MKRIRRFLDRLTEDRKLIVKSFPHPDGLGALAWKECSAFHWAKINLKTYKKSSDVGILRI